MKSGSLPYPGCATHHHQEAIYQFPWRKYFNCEEFSGGFVRRDGRSPKVLRRSHSMKLSVEISCAENQKMTRNSDHSFAIIRFNEKTYISGGVVAVVKGSDSAQRTLNDFEWSQTQEDRSSGWRYFLEESDLQPGTDPQKATRLRQLRLDLQESQAKTL
jgi:hypothetical protein